MAREIAWYDLTLVPTMAQWDGLDSAYAFLRDQFGVVLAEDDDGNVYVETLAPNGNAARSGQVRFLFGALVLILGMPKGNLHQYIHLCKFGFSRFFLIFTEQ